MKVPRVPRGIPKRLPPKPARTARAVPPPTRDHLAYVQALGPGSPKDAVAYQTLEPEPIPEPLPTPEPSPKKDYLDYSKEEVDAMKWMPRKLAADELNSPEHRRKVAKWQSPAIWVCSLMAFGMGLYTVQLWISLNREQPERNLPDDLIDRFDRNAEGYDDEVNRQEWLMGLHKRRKEMTEKAHGHVLEVSVGTGRNFEYYPIKNCDTVTFLDASGPMLAIAKRKWKEWQPDYFGRVVLKKQSALDPITPPYGAADGYDTVLQTMGLCSTPEPVRLLRNLESVTKADGQILLLEHGKSHYDWLNSLLDKTAAAHADHHGCWWNKDIGKIVEESGLEVVNMKRYNFGTTWWVELRPRAKVQQRKEVETAKGTAPAFPVAEKPWWYLWK